MPSWSRAALAALVTAALLSFVFTAVAVAGSPGDGPSHALAPVDSPEQIQQTENNGSQWLTDDDWLAGNTTWTVKLQSDGDAVWRIRENVNLSTESEREAFRSYLETAEYEETWQNTLLSFEQATTTASTSTGRSMEIRDVGQTVSPESAIANGTGWIALEFTWENFGRVDGNRLHIDDVIETEEGLWFKRLAETETLIIRPPNAAEYGVRNATSPPAQIDNSELRFEGPVTFDSNSLQVTFIGGGEDSSQLIFWLIGGLGFAGVVVLVLYFLASNRDQFELAFPDEADEKAELDGGSVTAPSDTPAPPPQSPETSTDDDEINVELLSDEERVERLLEQNGGRMKQANIVKETDWSNAKVSQLLSSMEEDGEIDKLRIGRENLISFPDEDVADIQDE